MSIYLSIHLSVYLGVLYCITSKFRNPYYLPELQVLFMFLHLSIYLCLYLYFPLVGLHYLS